MQILFIHGRDQENCTQAELLENWTAALKKSFENAKIPYPENLTLTLPYYGKELITQRDLYKKDINDGKFQMKSATQLDEFAEFEADFLEEMRIQAGISNKEVAEEEGKSSQQYKGIKNWTLTLMIVRILDRIKPVGNISIKKFTDDVATYLIVPDAQTKINELFLAALTDEPTIIIAHSLGSVIAYELLHSLSESNNRNIKGLITLGSPLGVKTVKRQLYPSASFPGILKGPWVNIYDKHDFVSLNPLVDKHFRVSPAITNHAIDNISENCHDIVPYLSSPLVAQSITKIMEV